MTMNRLILDRRTTCAGTAQVPVLSSVVTHQLGKPLNLLHSVCKSIYESICSVRAQLARTGTAVVTHYRHQS
jgi:hypothetical protein